MTTTMSGLRVYVKAPSTSLTADVANEDDDMKVARVFYSRRGNGPTYRWLYEERLAHWRPSRMQTTDLKLSNASWKSVPETLQAQLGQHYLD